MKIGMLDSGSGCLSVLHEAYHTLPAETEYVIYADLDHVPYGTKRQEEIVELTRKGIRMLADRGVDAVVIACNTATGAAIKAMREEFDFPIVGMEPAIKPALEIVLGEELQYVSYAAGCAREAEKQTKQETECKKETDCKQESRSNKGATLPKEDNSDKDAVLPKKYNTNMESTLSDPDRVMESHPLKRVLAAATPLALQAEKFHKLVNRYDEYDLVDPIALPGLVTFAEKEDFDEERICTYLLEEMDAHHYRKEDYGALVLGCTHFNYFKPIYRKLFGEEIRFVDGRHGTIRHLADLVGMAYNEKEVPVMFRCAEELHEKYHTTFFISGRETNREQDQHWLRLLQRLEAIRHI